MRPFRIDERVLSSADPGRDGVEIESSGWELWVDDGLWCVQVEDWGEPPLFEVRYYYPSLRWFIARRGATPAEALDAVRRDLTKLIRGNR